MEIKILIKTFLKKKQIPKGKNILLSLNFRLAIKIINQVSNFATI